MSLRCEMTNTTLSAGLGLTQPRAEDLIALLQNIQAEFHYLPERMLVAVAGHHRVPLTEIFHIATFYNCFTLEPRGRHRIQVCVGTACHVRGGQQILEKTLRNLKLPQPGTTADFQFSVEPVRCLGCCGLAPVLRVDQRTHAHLQQSLITGILRGHRAPLEPAKGPGRVVIPEQRARAG